MIAQATYAGLTHNFLGEIGHCSRSSTGQRGSPRNCRMQVRLLPRARTGVTEQADVRGLDPRSWEFESPRQYHVPDRHSRSTYRCEVMASLAVSKTAR